MSDSMDALIDQLTAAMTDTLSAEVAELISVAREQAMVQTGCMLKDMFIRVILQQASNQLGQPQLVSFELSPSFPDEDNAHLRAQPACDDSSSSIQNESDEHIRQEIETIRSQLAENERQLAQVKPLPIQAVADEFEDTVEKALVPETGCGYYVYGIVTGVNGQAALRLPEAGIDPAYPVCAVSYRDVQAVVSQVPLSEYGQESLEAGLNRLPWIEARVQAHQDIIQAVLTQRAVVPMRFCTIYRSEEHVEHMLAEHHDAFVELLVRLHEKQEWGAKVYCDRQTLADHLDEISPRIQQLRIEAAKKSPGAAYFAKRQIDEEVAEEMRRCGDEYAQRVHDLLSSFAAQAVTNPLQPSELTGRQEDMLLNGAYLVPRGQSAAFRAGLESLAAEGDGLGFVSELTGPWPPYNFVRIEESEGIV
jgi:uncharacterized protein (DUF4415 family)